jgi:hypothetical protein
MKIRFAFGIAAANFYLPITNDNGELNGIG